MYKVIKLFADLQDNEHIYNVGDTFPRDGIKVTDERIAELSGCDNKRGVPLIAEDVDKDPNIDKMNVEQLEAYAAENGIDLTGCKNKAERIAKIKEAKTADK